MNFQLIFVVFAFSVIVTNAQLKTNGILNNATTEEQEVVVITALFTKLNMILSEIQKINENINAIDKRLLSQDIELRSSLREQRVFEAHIKESLQTQKLLMHSLQMELQNNNMKSQRIEQLPQPSHTTATTHQSYFRSPEISYALEDLKNRGNWTGILRRLDGSVNFDRNWSEYRQGFGDFNEGEYFIGLENLYMMTSVNQKPMELLIIIKSFHNETRYAFYEEFVVACQQNKYKLQKLGKYHGNAGDSLVGHVGQKFSTKGEDNDNWNLHCAEMYHGGWWFNNCYNCYLTGPYMKWPRTINEGGIIWKGAFNGTALKFAEMAIRPKSA